MRWDHPFVPQPPRFTWASLLGFRIRYLNLVEDFARHERCEEYRRHLDQFEKPSYSDFWKYFYWDFFHDGWVDSITMDDNLTSVVMEITGPNIRRYTGENAYECVNVKFECKFEQVISMQTSWGEIDWSDAEGKPEFLYAEINALLGEKRKNWRG